MVASAVTRAMAIVVSSVEFLFDEENEIQTMEQSQ